MLSGQLDEKEQKFVDFKRSVKITSKDMKNMKSTFSGYIKNHDRLRFSNNQLATDLEIHAQSESQPFSGILSAISDKIRTQETSRELLVERIRGLCRERCKNYQIICGNLRSEIRARESCLYEERRKKKALEKTMINEGHIPAKVSLAQTALSTAMENSKRTSQSLEAKMEEFTNQRQSDIQSILNDYVYSELQYHAKALENLTKLHQLISTLPNKS